MKKTIFLILMVSVIVITCIFQYITCCSCRGATDGIVNQKTKESTVVTNFPFSVIDGDFSLNSNDNFNFKQGEFSMEAPVSAGVVTNVVLLKDYFIENKSKTIDITGYYTSNEKNSSTFKNLGIARSNAVKQYFGKVGMDLKRINTYGELRDNLVVSDENIFLGPIKYGVPKLSEGELIGDYDALLAEIKADPLVLNFKNKQTSISLNQKQHVKLGKIAKYLDKVKDAKCHVIGHADGIGDGVLNARLSQERADFAKNYLIQNSKIPENRIEAMSKGDSEPIAPNETSWGRAKNRRTVITIKK